MDTFKAIGQYIQEKRTSAGLSQEQLAEKLEVSKATISLYESGARKPTLKRLTQIAGILNTPIQSFLQFDIPKEVDLELALRAEGISNDDIRVIKIFIEGLKKDHENKQKENNK